MATTDSDDSTSSGNPMEVLGSWPECPITDIGPGDDILVRAARDVHATALTLEARRRDLGLDRGEAAAAAGIDRNTYTHLINGQTWPSSRVLASLATTFELRLYVVPSAAPNVLVDRLARFSGLQARRVQELLELLGQ